MMYLNANCCIVVLVTSTSPELINPDTLDSYHQQHSCVDHGNPGEKIQLSFVDLFLLLFSGGCVILYEIIDACV